MRDVTCTVGRKLGEGVSLLAERRLRVSERQAAQPEERKKSDQNERRKPVLAAGFERRAAADELQG